LRVAPLVLLVLAATARAGDEAPAIETKVLPGESRVISHTLSASRDTAVLGYQVLPRVALTTGADFSVLGFRFGGMELNAGMFGMVEVQTATKQPDAFLYVPSGPYLWRGLLGYSVALFLDEHSRRLLGPRGGLEIAISFRHESEHWTGGGGESGEDYDGVPHIGDFVMPELALRAPIGVIDLEVRVQGKLFLPTYESYSFGPGADLILRWRTMDWIHPFMALFGEYLLGKTVEDGAGTREIPDNYLVRGLVGLIFPGKVADLQIYVALAQGHGKGLLASEEYFRFGWGIRIGLFKRRPAPKPETTLPRDP